MHIAKTFSALAALAVTTALAAPAVGHAAAPIDTSKTYRITTSWSLVLEIAGASKGDGAPLTQWPVNGGSHQSWRFDPLPGSDRVRIRNVNSGKCLTAPGGSLAPRTKIVQWVCGRAGQEWAVERYASTDHDPTVDILNADSVDAALDVPGNTPYWGTQLRLWPFANGLNQSFQLTALN
jgi:hypothetical protein